MDTRDRTKRHIAQALEDLMGQRKLCDIRVHEICEKCGISRRTFYYHFRDKYDLLAWIINRAFISTGPSPAFIDLESRTNAYTAMKESPRFFKMVYADPGISDLSEHIVRYDVEYYTDFACNAMGVDQLSEEETFTLKMFVYGGVYMSRDWVLGGFQMDPRTMSLLTEKSMPEWLRHLVTNARDTCHAEG